MTRLSTFFLLTAVFAGSFAIAQNDTLLFEDFEGESFDYILTQAPNGDDADWINFDLDGLPDESPNDRPGEWFLSVGFDDTSNTVMASNSWTLSTQRVENYLILPPLQIVDDNAMLYWKSAPFQTPRFLDGYCVVVSTGSNAETDFTDTLSKYAEFVTQLDPLPDTTFNSFTFTDGFVYGEDGEYVSYDGDSLRLVGQLRPDSFSLAAYSGQTIYIAFVHTSVDDNLISIDDIFVRGTIADGIHSPEAAFGVRLIPNPAKDMTRVNFTMPYASSLDISILDISGRVVFNSMETNLSPGPHSIEINTSHLSPGIYSVISHTGSDMFPAKLVIE